MLRYTWLQDDTNVDLWLPRIFPKTVGFPMIEGHAAISSICSSVRRSICAEPCTIRGLHWDLHCVQIRMVISTREGPMYDRLKARESPSVSIPVAYTCTQQGSRVTICEYTCCLYMHTTRLALASHHLWVYQQLYIDCIKVAGSRVRLGNNLEAHVSTWTLNLSSTWLCILLLLSCAGTHPCSSRWSTFVYLRSIPCQNRYVKPQIWASIKRETQFPTEQLLTLKSSNVVPCCMFFQQWGLLGLGVKFYD